MPTTITIAPIESRPGYYTARCDGRLLCRSRQPFLDGARELLASGYPADTVIVMRSPASDADRLRSTIGTAARLTVTDNRYGVPQFRRWAAPAGDVAAPPVRESKSPNGPAHNRTSERIGTGAAS
jgi:hypothetical protein